MEVMIENKRMSQHNSGSELTGDEMKLFEYPQYVFTDLPKIEIVWFRTPLYSRRRPSRYYHIKVLNQTISIL